MNLLFTTILVTNLHPNALPKDLIKAFKIYGNIKEVWIPEKKNSNNRIEYENFGFVQFENEYECNAALSSMPPFILNQIVDVHLAKMNPSVKNTLFVSGFSNSVKESQILSHFKKYEPSEISLFRPKDSQPYALILFDEEIDRDLAVFNMNGSELDGNKLTVKFSKVPFKSGNEF